MDGVDPYAGGGLLPTLMDRGLEHQIRIGRDHQPGTVDQLLLQLAGAPAGISERHQPVGGGLLGAQGFQYILGSGDHELVSHLQGGVEAGSEAVQHETAVGVHRPSLQHRLLELGAGGRRQFELGQHGIQRHVHRDVDHSPMAPSSLCSHR